MSWRHRSQATSTKTTPPTRRAGTATSLFRVRADTARVAAPSQHSSMTMMKRAAGRAEHASRPSCTPGNRQRPFTSLVNGGDRTRGLRPQPARLGDTSRLSTRPTEGWLRAAVLPREEARAAPTPTQLTPRPRPDRQPHPRQRWRPPTLRTGLPWLGSWPGPTKRIRPAPQADTHPPLRSGRNECPRGRLRNRSRACAIGHVQAIAQTGERTSAWDAQSRDRAQSAP